LYGRLISAGAYTAGVLDFLFETLEKWEEATMQVLEKNIPGHRVVIDVFSGGMCGIISSLALQDTKPYDGKNNCRLYDAWVNLNDSENNTTLQQMLSDGDANVQEVISLLNSAFIEEVANRSFDMKNMKVWETGQRPWLSEKLM